MKGWLIMKIMVFFMSVVIGLTAVAETCRVCGTQLDYDWIECDGKGATTEQAVMFALKSGVSQAYGTVVDLSATQDNSSGFLSRNIEATNLYNVVDDKSLAITNSLAGTMVGSRSISSSGCDPIALKSSLNDVFGDVDVHEGTNSAPDRISAKFDADGSVSGSLCASQDVTNYISSGKLGSQKALSSSTEDITVTQNVGGNFSGNLFNEQVAVSTSGRVKEWKLIKEKTVGGMVEVHVHIKIIRPRDANVRTVMCMPVKVSQSVASTVFELENQRHVSGAKLAREIEASLLAALSGDANFQIRTPADQSMSIDVDAVNRLLVETGASPKTELDYMGEMLTTDYLLLSEFKDIKYSHKMGFDVKMGKVAKSDKFSLVLFLKLVNVKNGGQIQSSTVVVDMKNDEIAKLRAKNEDVKLLDVAMEKVSGTIQKWANEMSAMK